MAKKIYIGEILGDVKASIAALQTDMGTMSTDMGQMVAELIALKATMGQGISAINVSGGTDNVITIDTNDVTSNVTPPKFVCMCNGSLNFQGRIRSGNMDSMVGAINYRINGGSNKLVLTAPTTTSPSNLGVYVSFDVNIAVNSGDILEIVPTPPHGAYPSVLEGGATLGYNIVDVVNEGALIRA